jgi:hypothetical protein
LEIRKEELIIEDKKITIAKKIITLKIDKKTNE